MRQCKKCGATFLSGESLCLYCAEPLIPDAQRHSSKQKGRQKQSEHKNRRQSSGFQSSGEKQRAPDWDFFPNLGDVFGSCQGSGPPPINMFRAWRRESLIAAILAFTLGTFGAHWFYLGRPGRGVWYAIFFWTGIPTIIGIVDAVRLLLYAINGDF